MLLEALEPLRGRLEFCQRRSPVAFLDERSTVVDELVDVAAAQLLLRLRLSFFFLLRRHGSVATRQRSPPEACSAAPAAPAALRGTNRAARSPRSSRVRHWDCSTRGAAVFIDFGLDMTY